MRPLFLVLADGVDVTANILDRLLYLSVQDEAEDKADTLELAVDDRPSFGGARVAFPAEGAILSVSLGYLETGLVFLGTYEVDELRYTDPPATLVVRAKTARLPSAFRTPEDRSYHDMTLGEIATEIAGRFSLEARVEQSMAAVYVRHADCSAESPMAFLTRLAREYGGLARPVNGALVVIPRGSGVTATGQPLPPYTLARAAVSRFDYSRQTRIDAGQATAEGGEGEDKPGGVKVTWWDVSAGEQREHVEGKEPYTLIRFGAVDEETAIAQARAAKAARDRRSREFGWEMPGDPALTADQQVILSGFRPDIPTAWRALSVEHRLDAGGLRTTARAELFVTPAAEGTT